MAFSRGDEYGLLRLLTPNGIVSVGTVILLVSILGTYLVVQILYFWTLHPLAKIPGPPLCAISRIPYWLHCMKGNDVNWVHSLHTKYGPVLRFGPTDVSYASVEAWRDVHGHSKGQMEMEKAQEFSVQPVNGVPSMLTANFEDHARVRRLFSPAFSERALRRQEPLFRRYVDILISKLHELSRGNKPVEMTRLYNFTSFDTMADLCFGHPLGLLIKNEFSPWVNSIFESLKMLPFVQMINYYRPLKAIFERFEPKSITEQRIAHCKHSEERVNHRLQEGSDQPDIWNLVMAAQESGEGLSLEEMHSNAEIFMLAGSETTATLLSGVTYFLLANPTKMQLLLAEIRGSFESTQDINFDSLANLKYLNACLKETLRIYPPVPIGSPRVIPQGGRAVLGVWLPEETRVSCHHWSTYHSEANFRHAETFAPERWLGDPTYGGDVLDAHQPFGWGPRNCLGQSMALHEMRLILATVLHTFDLELCEESRGWPDQRAFALWFKKPLICFLRPVSLQQTL
ncbi:cytochrome P450 [Truncatella angustata]|uniref:Cytochrome P450 n=1 Tax=Truncatella angustata TaxID=152316 RepID=A0A9P8U7W3_9PEZI|nr:cytochrome P450 [Truncatella angustata]KAH6639994.1 cytochrome P450 [Truncatella angustata]